MKNIYEEARNFRKPGKRIIRNAGKKKKIYQETSKVIVK
jgi:hypothetical protein